MKLSVTDLRTNLKQARGFPVSHWRHGSALAPRIGTGATDRHWRYGSALALRIGTGSGVRAVAADQSKLRSDSRSIMPIAASIFPRLAFAFQ